MTQPQEPELSTHSPFSATELETSLAKGLFGSLSLQRFFDEYYLRLPLAIAGMSDEIRSLGTWSTIKAIVERPKSDLMVVRAGTRHPDGANWTADKLSAAVRDGYTVVVRHAERSDPRIEALASEFKNLFSGRVDVHIYCTPAAQFGFGWHYDAEEVFILQTTGDKTYSLRNNTVNPWPIEETLPINMHYEREIMPISRCRLTGGDWLYIPSGYWHMGRADAESISLAIGVSPRTGFDLLAHVRRSLMDSPLWRRRLVPAAAWRDLDALRAYFEQTIDELAIDLNKQLRSDDFVDKFLAALEGEKDSDTTLDE